jgi:uncharacterized oxidoreductase
VRHDAATLIELLADLLVRAGFSKDEASAIARSLTLSERLGYASHGIAQISRYIAELRAGNIVSGATPRTLQETPNSLVIDAQLGAGQVAMPIVLRKLYSKLATQASVTAAVRNCGHVGRLGEWVEHPAEAGYAALLFVNDNGLNRIVAPPGGRCGVTSTNPIAFSIPLSNGRVFSADMSTAAIALGKVERAKRAGMAVPPDCMQDAAGAPTRNPEALSEIPAGTILPMGGAQGYKGFALSIFVDLLVAGRAGHQGRELYDDGHLESGILFRARSYESTSGQIYCAGKSMPACRPDEAGAAAGRKNQSCETRRGLGYRVEPGIDRRSDSSCGAIWRANDDI